MRRPWALIFVLAFTSLPAFAQQQLKPLYDAIGPKPVGDATGPVLPHKLEALEITGSTRLSKDYIASELNLKNGAAVDDALLASTRQRLLSLGIYRSVLLFQKRGSSRGLVKLVIELEDDDSILSDWGLGGLVSMVYRANEGTSTSPDAPAIGYKGQVIGRNLFNSLHRGFLMGDIDATGQLREARLIYGVPRFTVEDVQFDTDLSAVDVRSRYLNALGFGVKAQSMWTKSYGNFDLQYGPALYANRRPRFAVPGFPTNTGGPRIAINKETRLNRFLPGAGYLLNGGLVYAVSHGHQSNAELNAGYTFDIFSYALFSVDAKFLSIGVKGYAARGETRLDLPLGGGVTGPSTAPVDLYIRLRAGRDEYEKTRLYGTSALIGLRYHSSGFIADLGLEILKSPKELIDSSLAEPSPVKLREAP